MRVTRSPAFLRQIENLPLAVDLFCGLGGWTEGLLAEGWRVAGYDIEAHEYDGQRYPAQLNIADVLTLDGSQFKDAHLIVASPPCQKYSYMAMPWTRAKDQAKAIRADETGLALADLNQLFNACFRIQREACAAAGRHIPLVVENVRGAQEWVGRSQWNYGPYYLWGDPPALMPAAVNAKKGMNCGRASDGPKQFGGPNDPRQFSANSKARKKASALAAKIPEPLSRHIARVYHP